MGNGDDSKCVSPLTSLQIGDLQSYLSDLSLFLAVESNKFYILVDNRPWLMNLGSRPAHLWQLMVTKSRLSPFANTKARGERKKGKQACSKPNALKSNKIFERWFSLVEAATLSQKIPVNKLRSSLQFGNELQFVNKLRSSLQFGNEFQFVNKLRSSLQFSNELHRTLYGFIVFEVAWDNVRGINYLNELQTDTSLAIEAKFMKRWEFDSIAQATSCISSWFSGTLSDQLLLKEYLDSAVEEVFFDAEEDFSRTIPIDDDEIVHNDNLCVPDTSPCCLGSSFSVHPVVSVDYGTSEPHTPPPTGPYKRRKVTKSLGTGVEVDIYSEETQSEVEDSLDSSESYTSDCETAVEPTQYRDVLILFRFNDRDLPFKLRHIIMSDLRLLTLLEAGLPSWVIFLQSYPGFCHLYRPWMCPLARALYVMISIVTVLIGFYDLYKNVPVLKATASRVCGPLFDWIETWEMVSRIKYLGTMLFLHNFQKAVKWFLTITRTTRSFFSVFALPMAEPLVKFFSFFLPMWNILVDVVESFCSVTWIVIETSGSLLGDLVEVILSPIWLIISVVWNIATSILYPIFWILWEILYAPIGMVLALAKFVDFIWCCISDLIGDIWQSVSGIFQLASTSRATVSTIEVSIWRSLWNDLFSQVFRAVRSILNGFVAFFAACNRHRLSIYNHIQDFIQRLLGRAPRSQPSDSRHIRTTLGNQPLVSFHMCECL